MPRSGKVSIVDVVLVASLVMLVSEVITKQTTRLPSALPRPATGWWRDSLRRLRRNGAGAFALAVVLSARTLALAGVLAGAVVAHFLRRAAALALAGVLAGAAVVAGLAVA